MANRKYPRIGSVRKRNKKHKQGRCKCGEVAPYRVDVEFNYMRGDDGVFWACEQHKNDVNFLIGE